jgi:hypothetical protein
MSSVLLTNGKQTILSSKVNIGTIYDTLPIGTIMFFNKHKSEIPAGWEIVHVGSTIITSDGNPLTTDYVSPSNVNFFPTPIRIPKTQALDVPYSEASSTSALNTGYGKDRYMSMQPPANSDRMDPLDQPCFYIYTIKKLS